MSAERSELDVERSAPHGAVFLSYASQDSEAAKKICDALRAAGIEVWFDQSELRGGDAWDQKIRRQIKECALFVPIISGNTQARPEGYFRLEWHLAEQRSLLFAKGRPFLVPVAVDDTSDRDALVPDAFLAVQWMKAPRGECSAAFVADVLRLLSGGGESRGSRAAPPASAAPAPAVAPPSSRVRKLIPLAVIVAVAAGTLALWQPWHGTAAPAQPATPVVAVTPEIAALRARIIPDRWQKGDFEAVDATLERLLQQNPENSDAWALRSIISSLQTMRLIDRGTKPLQDGRRAAERAMSLAPDSPLANLALGYHLTANINRGGDPEAGRAPMERAVAALPPDAITRYGALASAWNAYDLEGTAARAQEWLAAEPTATFPAWIMASMSVIARRPIDVATWAERVVNDPNITGVRAFSTMFDAQYYLHADLPAAAAMLDRVPPRGRAVPRIVFCRWLLHSAQGRHDEALQALAAVPDPFIGDVSYAGPKALLAALSHRWAGRPEPATVQLREAERLLRERLATDTENEEFRIGLALALAAQGRGAEARTELALVEPVLRGRAPSLYRGQLFSFVTQVHVQLGDAAAAAYYLRRIFTEPSNPPHTPASLRQDPRFRPIVAAPEMQALFQEFAALDPRPDAAAAAGKSAPADKSVAVLAFANLSSDKEQEYFSDGISEELLNVLAKVPGLKVSARTSAFYFKGKNTPIPEIAKQLGVAYVVEGSVQRAGDRVKITAQLIKAADGFHVWSEAFTRDMRDIFAVQDEIAGKIAASLTDKLGMTLPASAKTTPEAYTLYLQARAALAKRGVPSLRDAIRIFERVIALDPEYLPARSGLAISLSLIPSWTRSLALGENLEMINRAKREARLVIDRQPGNAEAWSALGYLLAIYDWRWQEAGEAVARSLALAPNDAEIANFAGDFYRFTLSPGEVVAMERRAVDLNPMQSVNHTDLSVAYLAAGQAELAIEPGRRGVTIAPELVENYEFLLRPYGALRRFDEMRSALAAARRAAKEKSGVLDNMEILAAIYEGRSAEALRLMEDFRPHVEGGGYSPGEYGFHYLQLGQPEKALPWLQLAAKGRDLSLVDPAIVDLGLIADHPVTRGILDEPGLKELLEVRARNARTANSNK